MFVFNPVTETSALPKVGQLAEDLKVDLKATVAVGGASDPYERAKDVAAFANGLGGTLLIGVHEDRSRGTVGKYEVLSAEDANSIAKAYEAAILDRCSPRPLYAVANIARDGGMVLAVNVWPQALQPVAVAVKGSSDTGERSFVFPVRVGRDTKFIPPEQLAMYMVPEIRRVAVLLGGLRSGEQVVLRGVFLWSQAPDDPLTVTFDKVVVEENKVVLTHTLSGSRVPISIPLDHVRSVWKPEKDESALPQVIIAGRVFKERDRILFTPYL